MDDDMDLYFDRFERLGLIYVSRNSNPIIITSSIFNRNMGTFGGAITINSPDWQKGITPFVYIS